MKNNTNHVYIAADFGGGSGRIIAGYFEQGKLILEEIHRFPNRQVRLGKHLYWDFLALFEEMKQGLRLAVQKGYQIKSIGIDTWGVDFGLIDKNGNLIGNPICYRDERTNGMPEKVFEKIEAKTYYSITGTQIMPINSIFQLYSLKEEQSAQLETAQHLLFMPDLFSYFLTGVVNNEYTIASTSGLLNAQKREWAWDIIRKLELPEHIFGEIVQPGTVRGVLKKEIARELGIEQIPIIATASHDTGSAIAAMPSTKSDTAFLSSGTWSLLGVELDYPILSQEACLGDFTNEGGVCGTIRFLQNITGLWILQNLMNEWKERGEEVSYEFIIKQAAESTIDSYIAVDDPIFQHPENMEDAIKEFCQKNQVKTPQNQAEFVRCVIQSLARKYKNAVININKCLPSPIKQLNIIGGGSQNSLLNQLTANELNLPVYAGPVEATAMGNILVQAMAQREIDNLMGLRQIVIQSVTPKVYYPE